VQLLWAEVGYRADYLFEVVCALGFDKSEICNQWVSFFIHQDILQLEIIEYDSEFVQIFQPQNDPSQYETYVIFIWLFKCRLLSRTAIGKWDQVAAVSNGAKVENIIFVFSAHVAFDQEWACVFCEKKILHGWAFSQRSGCEFLFGNDFKSHFHEIRLVVGCDEVNIRVSAFANFRLERNIEARGTELEITFVFLEVFKSMGKILSELWQKVNFLKLIRFAIETGSGTYGLDFEGIPILFGLRAAAVVSHFCKNINTKLELSWGKRIS
jgi:hypothetical protein